MCNPETVIVKETEKKTIFGQNRVLYGQVSGQLAVCLAV